MSTADPESLEARITGDWTETDSTIEFAEPGEEFAAIDASTMFVPYSRVRLSRCKECGDTYINKTYLDEHIARDHQATAHPSATKNTAPKRPAAGTVQERPNHPAYARPASAPAPVDTAKVRPLRPEAEPERPIRPEQDSTPPARIPRRRGAPRSRPKPR